VINKALKKIQKKYQIKSKELAEKAEISERIISEFKNGKRNLGYKALWLLIVALGKIDLKARMDLGLYIGGGSSIDGEIYWNKVLSGRSKKELDPLKKAISQEQDNTDNLIE